MGKFPPHVYTVIVATSVLLCAAPRSVRATTWDEPWQEQVVRDADTFLKARVIKNEDGKRITLKTLHRLAGADVPETLIVDRFSLLQISSTTVGLKDDEVRFNFADNEDWYFFLKKVKDETTWSMATPTAGYAGIDGKSVIATYRHSYHQALVPADMYEPSMIAIFEYLHGRRYDEAFIRQLFQTWLTRAPEPLEQGKPADVFSKQHVALECFYYFGSPDEYGLLEPFLKCPSYHVQISAVRAVSRIDTPQARRRLWDFLTDNSTHGFARVMAAWGLKRLNAREYLPKLREFTRTAPEEETGFGGNIMDPRVGTRFPHSVRAACEQLVSEW